VLTGHKWTSINHRYCIESGFTVPHHQHQNYSEGEGSNFNLSVDTAPPCVQTREGSKFYNHNDVELLGDKELDIVDDDLNEYLSVSEDEQDSIMESYSFLSEHSDASVDFVRKRTALITSALI